MTNQIRDQIQYRHGDAADMLPRERLLDTIIDSAVDIHVDDHATDRLWHLFGFESDHASYLYQVLHRWAFLSRR